MGEYKDQSKLDIAILPHFYCNERLGDNTERCSECKWAPNAHLQCLCGHGGRGARLRSDEKAARCTREREHGESDARSPLFARARRRRRDSVGEHRRQRPGAVASSNLSKALTIPSLSLPPPSTVCYRRPPAKGRVGRVSFHPRRQGQLSTYARAEEIDGQERHRLSRRMVQLVRVLHFTCSAALKLVVRFGHPSMEGILDGST